MNAPGRLLLPLILLFTLITGLIFLLAPTLKNYHIDSNVLIGANALFFLISIVSFSIQRKGLQNKNPHVFVRSVMAGMMVKMVICIIVVIAYVSFSGTGFNTRAVFIALFLYLIYLATEVFVVMKMNKNKKTDG
ncbi:MAG: hypothetical protein ABI741_13670 [Ferruginibacter sp.]